MQAWHRQSGQEVTPKGLAVGTVGQDRVKTGTGPALGSAFPLGLPVTFG